MNRKGFAYLIAVLILGLLAFMGIFLQQSSSAEYSQAAISVYRTMGRQLAEAAAEEASVMLEERFRDKTATGFFQQLLWQASTSQPPQLGGATGLNPTLLQDFSDLKDKVTQVLTLKDYHMTRAGFEIEKILPSIKDLRPIPNGPLDNPANYYSPTDRNTKFDNLYSKDWYLTIQLDVTVSLQKRRKFKIDYTISRDVKLLNLSPIARNYSMFSILGHAIPSGGDSAQIQAAIRNDMNQPTTAGGRLFLWNMPFQSRVYLRGPSIIDLETPELAVDRSTYYGAYNLRPDADPEPGVNQAYQFSDTFYGMSYFPTLGRAIFPSRSAWDAIAVWWRGGRRTRGDQAANQTIYRGVYEHETVYGGLLPKFNRTFRETFGDIYREGIQDTYFRGTAVSQKFLPGGPFCRTPWKYVPPASNRPLFSPNQTDPAARAFPTQEEHLRVEHRWDPENADVANQSKIYARVQKIKYNHVTGNINAPPPEEMLEFTLSYYNNPDPSGFLGRLGYSLSSLGESFWNRMVLPFEVIGALAAPLINRFWPGQDTVVTAAAEAEVRNLFPTNFKFNFRAMATRRFTDEKDPNIPTDKDGRWILNGVYWFDSFQLNESITYVGTGTIMVTQYNPDRPFKIRGNVIALKASDGVTPLGHLNIFYYPWDGTSTNLERRLLEIEGSGNVIEASVFSCFGIKTTSGDILDLTEIGIDPAENIWGDCLAEIGQRSNMIYGNYINNHMFKAFQRGDLWVVHNFNNPLFFDRNGNDFSIVQQRIDASEEGRRAYEVMAHEFFLSPKIQHVALTGGSDD